MMTQRIPPKTIVRTMSLLSTLYCLKSRVQGVYRVRIKSKLQNLHLYFFYQRQILNFFVLLEIYQPTRQMNANRTAQADAFSFPSNLSISLSLCALRSIIPARKIWILNAFDISGLDILRQLSCRCCCRCFRKSHSDKLFSLTHTHAHDTHAHTWTRVFIETKADFSF